MTFAALLLMTVTTLAAAQAAGNVPQGEPPAAYLAAAYLLAGAYAAGGMLFAVAFAWRGAQRIDPAAQGAPWSFRLLIIPGAAALWPMLALRWWRAVRGGRA